MNGPLSRPYLETLSAGELFRMADYCGIDIPPGLDRVFVIEELLDYGSDGSAGEDQAEAPLAETEFSESASLPEHYNISFIEVMPRDPLWAFVFWEIKAGDRETLENAPDFGGYYLKVCPWELTASAARRRISPESAQKEGIFFISLGPEDTSWYLGLTGAGGRPYKVEICAELGEEEIALAVSGPFRLPALAGREKTASPLARLSGADELRIVRNGDRLSRSRRAGIVTAG